MANDLYAAEMELAKLQDGYQTLLQEYKNNGDIDIFVDLQNMLLDFLDKVKELPASDEKFEIICTITLLSNAINSLLH